MRLGADGRAQNALAAEHDVVGFGDGPGIAEAGQHLLDRAGAPPTLTLDDGELDAGDVDAGQAAAAPALFAEGLRLVREHLLDGAHRTLEGLLVLTDVDDDAVRSQQHECSLTVDCQHDPTAPEHRGQPTELFGVVGDLTLVAHSSFLLQRWRGPPRA